ncbi:MAG: PEP/pyruvate-binding domain-containing protein [Pseudomonadota bacterium]
MPQYCLRLTDPDATRVALVGGKAANLAHLLRHGLTVPPAFVVTTEVYQRFVGNLSADLQAAVQGGPISPVRGAEIRQGLIHAPIVPELINTIMAAEATLRAEIDNAALYAIRSSATTEDSESASFAGQHATYYYGARGSLLEMVRNCWASLFTDSAIHYRETHGVSHGAARMAVIVQVMINAEVSGVSFSADPATGKRESIVTESSWGMGAALVDGRVTPDHFVCDRKSGTVLSRRIADKRVMVPGRPVPPGEPRLAVVANADRRRATLEDDQIKTITELVLSAETAFDAPQDVEWALLDGTIYLLQARPITTILADDLAPPPPGKWVIFKPLVENFTEPLTPLAEDIFGRDLPPGLALFQGRAYLSLDKVKRLSPVRLSDVQATQICYLGEVKDLSALRLSPLKLIAGVIGLLLFATSYGVFLGRTRDLPDDALESFRQRVRAVRADDALGPRESLWTLTGCNAPFLAPIGWLPLAVNLGAVRYFFWLALLKIFLKRWAPDLPNEASAFLCAGGAGLKSVEMGHGIRDLAHAARNDQEVLGWFKYASIGDIWETTKHADPDKEFVKAFNAYVAEHGHRAMREFEIAVPRWREDPTAIFAMIKNYLLSADEPPRVEAQARARRQRLRQRLQRSVSHHFGEKHLGIRWRLLMHCVNRAKYFTKLRENSRYYHIMVNEVVRLKILDLERELLERQQLRCAGDAFYLRMGELMELQRGDLVWRDVEQRIRERRLTWIRQSKQTPPRTLGFDLSADTRIDQTPEALLRGFGASPGRYRGCAKVIRDPASDGPLEPGEILVAPYTDPAWTPLFLTARGAVVEVGSYLSHAGTVAREYAMPCVVDVARACEIITSGMMIEIDGEAGTVEIIEERAP